MLPKYDKLYMWHIEYTCSRTPGQVSHGNIEATGFAEAISVFYEAGQTCTGKHILRRAVVEESLTLEETIRLLVEIAHFALNDQLAARLYQQ